MRTIILILLTTLIALQYKLWLGDGGIFQRREIEKKILQQAKENNKLALRNQGMEANILELKSGDQALEEEARYELGMVKKGEAYYHFVD